MQKIPYIIIVILLAIIIFLRMCSGNSTGNKIEKIKHDTTYVPVPPIKIHDTIYTPNPTPIESIANDNWDTTKGDYPDSTLPLLRKQYDSVCSKFFTTNIYWGHFRINYNIDSVGYADVVDSIKFNNLISRRFTYSIIIPQKTMVINNDTTIFQKPRNQWYLGGGITGNKTLLNSAYLGFLLKTKKDQVYELGIEQPLNGSTYSIKVGTYFKIHL